MSSSDILRELLIDIARTGMGQPLPPKCPDCGATKCCYECATRGGNGSDLLDQTEDKS